MEAFVGIDVAFAKGKVLPLLRLHLGGRTTHAFSHSSVGFTRHT